MMRPILYRNAVRWLVVRAALLAAAAGAASVGGCASAPPVVEQRGGFEDPERAVQAFRVAWNTQRLDEVVATFEPGRRDAVRAHLTSRPQRMQGFEVVEGAVASQCHPRGAYWKTATLQLRPRGESLSVPVRDREIVWLRLQDGYWFMYSL